MIPLCTPLVVVAKYFLGHPPHYPLLVGNLASSLNRAETEFSGQLVINVEHTALEQPEAFDRFVRKPDVHTRLVVFEFGPARKQTLQRNLDRNPKVERQVRPRRKAIDLAHPFGM